MFCLSILFEPSQSHRIELILAAVVLLRSVRSEDIKDEIGIVIPQLRISQQPSGGTVPKGECECVVLSGTKSSPLKIKITVGPKGLPSGAQNQFSGRILYEEIIKNLIVYR